MSSSTRRRLVACAIACGVAGTPRAMAQPVSDPLETPLHVTTEFTLSTASGSEMRLPPAYILSERSWDALDTEVRRLQDAETRLMAENVSLRKSASASGRGSLLLAVTATLIVGFAAGYYLDRVRE